MGLAQEQLEPPESRPARAWQGSRWRLLGLSAGCGLIAGLSINSLPGLPLIWIALAGLWMLTATTTWWGGVAAALWGGAAVLGSHSWLLGLHPLDWIGVEGVWSRIVTVLVWLLVGAAGAAAVVAWWWLSRYYPSHRWFGAVTLAVLWGCGEVLLARSPLFWIGLSTAALPHDRILAGLGRLGGPGLLAGVQLMSGWWVWRFLGLTAGERRRWLAVGVAAMVAWHAMGGLALAAARAPADAAKAPLKLGVLQTAIPTREKFTAAALHELEARMRGAIDTSARSGAEWLLLPEGNLAPGQRPPVRSSGPPATVGLLTGGFRRYRQSYRSSLLVYPPARTWPALSIDKHRLVLLGEWLPWQRLGLPFGLSAVGGLQPGGADRLLAGPPLPWQAAVAICYEISQAHALADASRRGAEVLIAVANLDPYPMALQRQFLALAQQRAIETGRWLVSATNTGPSAVVNQRGRVVQQLPPSAEGLALWDVELHNQPTPYNRLGDAPLLVLGSLLALSGWLTARRGERP